MTAPAPFIHPHALVDQGAVIGSGTRVWAFAHVVAGAVLGRDCNICDHTFVEGRVTVGDRVTLKCGVYLWDGLVLEDDVFVGPCAAFTNDLRPRSRQHPDGYPKTTLRQGCSIGANATILPGLTIGRWAMIGAGAVVTRDVPDFALVAGNPARSRGWVCRCGQKLGNLTSQEVRSEVADGACGSGILPDGSRDIPVPCSTPVTGIGPGSKMLPEPSGRMPEPLSMTATSDRPPSQEISCPCGRTYRAKPDQTIEEKPDAT